jgi:hypothetical protein
MTARSYSDLSDSATTFDPEEQLDRDIDERMKGMSKEEAVAREICRSKTCEGINCCQWPAQGGRTSCPVKAGGYDDAARAAIAAADKWDAEQRQPEISAGQDAAIQDELDHPPASIMEEGK